MPQQGHTGGELGFESPRRARQTPQSLEGHDCQLRLPQFTQASPLSVQCLVPGLGVQVTVDQCLDPIQARAGLRQQTPRGRAILGLVDFGDFGGGGQQQFLRQRFDTLFNPLLRRNVIVLWILEDSLELRHRLGIALFGHQAAGGAQSLGEIAATESGFAPRLGWRLGWPVWGSSGLIGGRCLLIRGSEHRACQPGQRAGSEQGLSPDRMGTVAQPRQPNPDNRATDQAGRHSSAPRRLRPDPDHEPGLEDRDRTCPCGDQLAPCAALASIVGVEGKVICRGRANRSPTGRISRAIAVHGALDCGRAEPKLARRGCQRDQNQRDQNQRDQNQRDQNQRGQNQSGQDSVRPRLGRGGCSPHRCAATAQWCDLSVGRAGTRPRWRFLHWRSFACPGGFGLQCAPGFPGGPTAC